MNQGSYKELLWLIILCQNGSFLLTNLYKMLVQEIYSFLVANFNLLKYINQVYFSFISRYCYGLIQRVNCDFFLYIILVNLEETNLYKIYMNEILYKIPRIIKVIRFISIWVHLRWHLHIKRAQQWKDSP